MIFGKRTLFRPYNPKFGVSVTFFGGLDVFLAKCWALTYCDNEEDCLFN
jgi:hypothetical protein